MHFSCFTFEEAFKDVNACVLNRPDFITSSRTGQMSECLGLSYSVEDASSFMFDDPKIHRISYDYASVFYDFMLSGGTDAKSAFKDYPNIAKFIDKPKSKELPDNFNTLYGPRIKKQLPKLIEELKSLENSRRGSILILSENDQVLLGSDETIEYPCTISVTFFVRDGKLHVVNHMRSQNTAIVMQLDMYLNGRLMHTVAELLELQLGSFTSTIASAHIFERDYDYVRKIIS